MKVALVVGHTGRASGAYSSFLQESEFFYWSEIVHGINARLRFLGIDSKVFIHTTIPYNQRMNELAAKTRDFDLVVEFHFNGSVSNIANGTETLYFFNSSKGKQFASFFNEEICSWFGTTNRGIKALYNEQQNGFGFVYKTKPPAILCFNSVMVRL